METFVVYDARREQAFVRFPGESLPPAEAGHLDTGLWVEFGPGGPARLQLLAVEHPFFARSEEFIERVTGLVGRSVVLWVRDCQQREETAVGEVRLDEAEVAGLAVAWELARRELRDRAARVGTVAPVTEPPAAERGGLRWLVPARLEPVLARADRRVTAVRAGFDSRIALPAAVSEALRVEPLVRVGIVGGVLRLRGRVRAGEVPPGRVVLGLVGVDDEVELTYDAALGELGGELELGAPLRTLPDGEVVSLLKLRVLPERAEDD